MLREQAVDSLGSIVETQPLTTAKLAAIRPLIRLLAADRNEIVRMKATELLGEVGNRRDHAVLVALTADKCWTVRASAYSSLTQLGRRTSLAVIVNGFQDRNPVVQAYAAVAAFDLVGCQAVDLLTPNMKLFKATRARVGLLHVLAACGDERARGELIVLSELPNQQISSAAEGALADPMLQKSL
ncbi:MAG TPA: HEAT repeat domain-containing protein [Fimbriimonadaceae bacterium]